MLKAPKGKLLHQNNKTPQNKTLISTSDEMLALSTAQPENCDLDINLCIAGACENRMIGSLPEPELNILQSD